MRTRRRLPPFTCVAAVTSVAAADGVTGIAGVAAVNGGCCCI